MREVAINKKSCLVVGLENGSVLVLAYRKGLQTMSAKAEHLKAVTEMCISPCNRYIITSGKDCMIFVYHATL